MKNKWFLKGFMFCFACMVIIALTYTASFGYYGLPYSQDTSLQWGNLFSNYNLDTSIYSTLGLQTSSYNENFTNPYATVSSIGSTYSDMFSNASEQSFIYSNVFGFSLDTGSYSYQDPIFAAGGEHLNVGNYISSFGSQSDWTQSIVGSSFQTESYFNAPWTHYESTYGAGSGMNSFPFGQAAGGASIAYANPSVFSYNPGVNAIMNLVTYGPGMTQVGQAMGNQMMYTSEGMGFYGNPYYVNPYSGSGWYFPAGVQSSAAATP